MANAPPTHSLKLNSGYDMPLVGFGTYKIPKDVCPGTVYNAIKAGYRLLDGACGRPSLGIIYTPLLTSQSQTTATNSKLASVSLVP